ncbi:hypothetical protein PC1_084 [Pseudomonas phage PC1]
MGFLLFTVLVVGLSQEAFLLPFPGADLLLVFVHGLRRLRGRVRLPGTIAEAVAREGDQGDGEQDARRGPDLGGGEAEHGSDPALVHALDRGGGAGRSRSGLAAHDHVLRVLAVTHARLRGIDHLRGGCLGGAGFRHDASPSELVGLLSGLRLVAGMARGDGFHVSAGDAGGAIQLLHGGHRGLSVLGPVSVIRRVQAQDRLLELGVQLHGRLLRRIGQDLRLSVPIGYTPGLPGFGFDTSAADRCRVTGFSPVPVGLNVAVYRLLAVRLGAFLKITLAIGHLLQGRMSFRVSLPVAFEEAGVQGDLLRRSGDGQAALVERVGLTAQADRAARQGSGQDKGCLDDGGHLYSSPGLVLDLGDGGQDVRDHGVVRREHHGQVGSGNSAIRDRAHEGGDGGRTARGDDRHFQLLVAQGVRSRGDGQRVRGRVVGGVGDPVQGVQRHHEGRGDLIHGVVGRIAHDSDGARFVSAGAEAPEDRHAEGPALPVGAGNDFGGGCVVQPGQAVALELGGSGLLGRGRGGGEDDHGVSALNEGVAGLVPVQGYKVSGHDEFSRVRFKQKGGPVSDRPALRVLRGRALPGGRDCLSW